MTLSGLTALSSFTDKAPVSPTYMNAKFGEIQANLDQIGAVAFSTSSLTARLGYVHVDDYGGVADGATDTSAALDAAVVAARAYGFGEVHFSAGDYNFTTSPSTISYGLTLIGRGTPGSFSAGVAQPFTNLIHNYDGNFLVFDGTAGTALGNGVGLRNLALVQANGSSSVLGKGTAIKLTGTDTNNRVNWVRLDNVQVERLGGSDEWTWGIEMDGSVVGGTDGIRDLWLTRSRIVSSTSSGGGLDIKGAFNVFVSDTQFNLTHTRVRVSGTTANCSSNINFINCSGQTLELDFCANTVIMGGAWSYISTTSNVRPTTVIMPGRVTSTFTNNAGLNIGDLAYDDTVGAWITNQHIRLGNNHGFQSYTTTGSASDLLRITSTNVVQIDGTGRGSVFGQRTNFVPGTSSNPAWAFSSESSLGFYRSGVSTIAQSTGTLNLALNGVRLSMRTVAAASLDSTTLAVNEVAFSIGGASGASLAIRSGGTVWYFGSSLSTKG